ncbi:thioredoxin domain-containing protein [Winogradskyella sp. PG-2]|uniref:thioredoxin domain-containing protein n=1 Tax=Winogradskyella sp. PG-2 TaxID=754409 RepID=UPI001E550EFC|nr:thioredoxin domain-containing protein [Winogradskyella sp. PG-2]
MKKILYFILINFLALSCSQDNKTGSIRSEKKSNDLIKETSPYLLQHAYNPVDWKAWNDESLKIAKEQNKLIIISVGYSACHWCHVMEEESFENDSVAKLMNDNFINIKVDREERPDVDQIYMRAVQLMTGSGGWPLNCITLPDGRPVFGGTYFTKNQWIKVLKDMSSLYRDDPEKVIAYAEKLTDGVKKSDLITVNKASVQFDAKMLKIVVDEFKPLLDFKIGGLKGEPKFPMPSNLNFLLRYSFQKNSKELLDYVLTSLTKMSNGGIYDQIGGGFSRYSVDDKWHIPHFEKMLYDNAQLISLYSKAYQISNDKNYKTIVEETISFVESDLADKNSSFYSALDADSENREGELEEGVYYSWTEEELKTELEDDFALFKAYYNINAKSKWGKDTYVLYKTLSDEEFTEKHKLSLIDLNAKIKYWKTTLKKTRDLRKSPRKDDKALTSWNALMLKAYLDAYRALGDDSYLHKAIKNANFIKENQIQNNGELFHNYKNGKSSIEGFSEDYAHTINAFIELYQMTFDEQWLNLSKDLMDYALAHFLNTESSMFYFTSDKETNLITRKTEIYDNVIPSSNSVLADCLFKLGHYYSDKTYSNLASQMLSNVSDDIIKAPSAYTNWLNLYMNYSNPFYEVAIAGKDAKNKLRDISSFYLPNILISGSQSPSNLPLLKNKFIEEETLIYVCVNGTCKLPVSSTEKAKSQISK